MLITNKLSSLLKVSFICLVPSYEKRSYERGKRGSDKSKKIQKKFNLLKHKTDKMLIRQES